MNEGGLPVVFGSWVGNSRNLGYGNGGYGEAFLGGLPGGHGVFYRRGKAVRTGKNLGRCCARRLSTVQPRYGGAAQR